MSICTAGYVQKCRCYEVRYFNILCTKGWGNCVPMYSNKCSEIRKTFCALLQKIADISRSARYHRGGTSPGDPEQGTAHSCTGSRI